MSWITIKPWLILALIFGLGMVAGGSLVTLYHHDRPDNPPGAQQLRAHWLARLSMRLDLTPDQQAKVGQIISDATVKMESLHRDEIGRFGKIMDEANEQIEPILTPEQQAKLKEMISERQREFSGRMRPWEGGPRPGPGGPGGGFQRDGQPMPPPQAP